MRRQLITLALLSACLLVFLWKAASTPEPEAVPATQQAVDPPARPPTVVRVATGTSLLDPTTLGWPIDLRLVAPGITPELLDEDDTHPIVALPGAEARTVAANVALLTQQAGFFAVGDESRPGRNIRRYVRGEQRVIAVTGRLADGAFLAFVDPVTDDWVTLGDEASPRALLARLPPPPEPLSGSAEEKQDEQPQPSDVSP